jgi:hypothetical protein
VPAARHRRHFCKSDKEDASVLQKIDSGAHLEGNSLKTRLMLLWRPARRPMVTSLPARTALGSTASTT